MAIKIKEKKKTQRILFQSHGTVTQLYYNLSDINLRNHFQGIASCLKSDKACAARFLNVL